MRHESTVFEGSGPKRVLHSGPGDAVEVEGVVAHPPGHGALLASGAGLVGLALDAQVHDVVPGHCPMSKMYMMIKVGMCQCLQELNV